MQETTSPCAEEHRKNLLHVMDAREGTRVWVGGKHGKARRRSPWEPGEQQSLATGEEVYSHRLGGFAFIWEGRTLEEPAIGAKLWTGGGSKDEKVPPALPLLCYAVGKLEPRSSLPSASLQ